MPRVRTLTPFPALLALTALALTAVAAAAPSALADDTVTVDFDSAPPALDTPIRFEYQQSAFVSFDRNDGMRPYRKSAPGLARSGSTVANIGGDLCLPEGGAGSDCEFPLGGTVGRLTKTATSVKIYAGLFAPTSGNVTVQLQALRADGSIAATGAALPVSANGFNTEVSVTSAAPDIARFRVVVGGEGGPGALVGFDDLTLVYPKNSLPDVALSASPNTVTLHTSDITNMRAIPIKVQRLNGSQGPLSYSVTGLPQGVEAQILPANPTASDSPDLSVTAKKGTPPSPNGVPSTVTVTADPEHKASVGQGPTSVTVPVKVASPFELRARGSTDVEVLNCGTVEVPMTLARDFAYSDTTDLEVQGLPAGVTATIEPGNSIAPGGGYVSVKVRLSASAELVPDSEFTVVAKSRNPGQTRSVKYKLRQGTPTTTVLSPANRVINAPQRLREGSMVTLQSQGFCPGTKVRVGNSAAGVDDTTISPDGRYLTFRTPRLATSGRIRVVPPRTLEYDAVGNVTVNAFRERNSLPFDSTRVDGLSLGEAEDAFGWDELFFKINPCWPWGNCSIPTGIPDPTAALAYGIIDRLMAGSSGHCFGISRAVQDWIANPTTLNRFTDRNGDPIRAIPGQSNELESHLDSKHAGQFSMEYLHAWFWRSKSLANNVNELERQLRSGNYPLITLRIGRTDGHAVAAYDVVTREDNSKDILVYDGNHSFTDEELTSGTKHRDREATKSVIHVNPTRTRWTYDFGLSSVGIKSGGSADLGVFKRNVIPENATLPGLVDLLDGAAYLVFGAGDGSVRSAGRSAGSDYLPLLEPGSPGEAGAVGRRGSGPLAHTVRGVKDGRYQQAVFGDGTVSSVSVRTARGVVDTTAALPSADGVTFAAGGARPRPVTLNVGTTGAQSSQTATVVTRTSRGARETARLAGGQLRFAHTGTPTTASVRLQGVQTQGGPATFESGPMKIGTGDTVTVRPTSWRTLGTARVTVRTKAGRTSSRIVGNRAKPPAHLAITALKARGATAQATLRFARVPKLAAAGMTLRAIRGRTTIARRSFNLGQVRAGSRTVRWTLPARARIRGVRIVADAALAVSGRHAGTVRRTRSAPLRLR